MIFTWYIQSHNRKVPARVSGQIKALRKRGICSKNFRLFSPNPSRCLISESCKKNTCFKFNQLLKSFSDPTGVCAAAVAGLRPQLQTRSGFLPAAPPAVAFTHRSKDGTSGSFQATLWLGGRSTHSGVGCLPMAPAGCLWQERIKKRVFYTMEIVFQAQMDHRCSRALTGQDRYIQKAFSYLLTLPKHCRHPCQEAGSGKEV